MTKELAGEKVVPDWEWYRIIIESAPDIINIVDQEGVILYTTSSNRHSFCSPAGTKIFDYIVEEQQPLVREIIDLLFQTGRNDYFEFASTHLNDTRWYMTRLAPVQSRDGVAAVALFIREITRRRHAEEALNRMNFELEKRVEERTRALNEYARQLEATQSLNLVLRLSENQNEVLQILAEHSRRALGASMTGIFRWSASSNNRLEYVTGNEHPSLNSENRQHNFPQEFMQALETGQVRCITDIETTGAENPLLNFYAAHQVQALLMAPLSAGEAFTGLLILGFSSPHRCTREDEFLLRAFADSVCSTLYGNHAMQHLEQNILNREQELAILYDIASISNETADLNIHNVLKKSLERVVEFSKFHAGVIHLFGAGRQSLKHATVIRSGADLLAGIPAGAQQSLYRRASEKKNLYLLETLHDKDLAYFGIPILAHGHMLGLFSLFGRRDLLHTPEIIHLIKSIVGQLGLVIENAQHRKQAENALVLHERQRLARDLHDSITQSLYGLAISGDIGRKMLERGEYDRLSQTMENICDVSLQAMKEMRLMLFELRPLALEKEGLIQALNLRLETVERRAGMEVSLTVFDNVQIPYPIEVDLYHLATEALNNSLKHSGAHSIAVTLGARPGCLFMEISDDGKGFDPAKVPRGGIGLTGMSERARRLGGTIHISSEPGSGTRVHIEICQDQKVVSTEAR